MFLTFVDIKKYFLIDFTMIKDIRRMKAKIFIHISDAHGHRERFFDNFFLMLMSIGKLKRKIFIYIFDVYGCWKTFSDRVYDVTRHWKYAM